MRWVKEWVAGWTKTRFFGKTDHQLTSRGAASSGYPLILDSAGKIDSTFLDSEDVADIVGTMVTGNTETGIAVTYQDSDNTLDFVVDTEFISDTVGAMVTGNTETGITVTYQDSDNTLDFDAQTPGDARYGQLAAANTWSSTNRFDGTITFSPGTTQDYVWGDDGSGVLTLTSSLSGGANTLRLYTADGDGTDVVAVQLWGKGNAGDVSNRERLIIQYAFTSMDILSEAQGTGTLRPIIIYTEGNTNQLRLATNGNVGVAVDPTAKLHVNQSSTTAAIPTLRLKQSDLSEEFIRFESTVSAGNPINTTALGAYYGRVRVYVEGVGAKWMALYD